MTDSCRAMNYIFPQVSVTIL